MLNLCSPNAIQSWIAKYVRSELWFAWHPCDVHMPFPGVTSWSYFWLPHSGWRCCNDVTDAELEWSTYNGNYHAHIFQWQIKLGVVPWSLHGISARTWQRCHTVKTKMGRVHLTIAHLVCCGRQYGGLYIYMHACRHHIAAGLPLYI